MTNYEPYFRIEITIYDCMVSVLRVLRVGLGLVCTQPYYNVCFVS